MYYFETERQAVPAVGEVDVVTDDPHTPTRQQHVGILNMSEKK